MAKIGAVFDPELIELMKSALDDAATILPKAKRTSSIKVRLASRILKAAAKGERDPIQLRIAALLEIEGDQEPDVAQCYLQLHRLREQVEQAAKSP